MFTVLVTLAVRVKPCHDQNSIICVAEGCIKESKMRFITIWSFPGVPLRERIERTKDLWSMCVDNILPKRVRYWVTIREIAKATMTSQNVPATSLDNILDNLGNLKDGKPLEQFKWTEKESA
jgi:hypothetical protein